MKRLLSIIFTLLFFTMFAQQQTFSVHYKEIPAIEVLNQLENDFSIHFSYLDTLIKDKRISLQKKQLTLDVLLKILQKQMKIVFQKIDENYYVLLPYRTPKWQQQAIKEVIIKGFLTRGISQKKDGSYLINLQKMGILPGIAGVDVLEMIQQLPGVISLDETATDFAIRGGETDQNKIIFDGIPIYQKGHLFGMISVFNPNSIDKIKLFYKGTDARYEGGNSGIIDITTKNSIANNKQFNVGIDGLSADAIIYLPLIKNKLSLSLSGRRSTRDIWQTPTSINMEKQVFQNTNVTSSQSHINNFNFHDITAKINYQPNINHRYTINYLHISQLLDFENSLISKPKNIYLNTLHTYTDGFSFSARNKLLKSYTLYSQFGMSWYDLSFQNTTLKNRNEIGVVNKENFVSDTYFRTELSHRNNSFHQWILGYIYNEKRSVYLFKLTVENQIYIYNFLKDKINTQALYAKYRYRNHKLFDVDAGLRLNYLQELYKTYFEPRFVISKNVVPHLKFQITGELKHQIVQQYNKTVIGLLNLENKIWQVANQNNFPVVGEKQLSGGFIYNNHTWSGEIDFYHKDLENITLTVPYRIYNQYKYLVGDKSINGIDIYLKKKWQKFNLLGSFTTGTVMNKFASIKNSKAFVSNKHVKYRVNLLAQYNNKHLKMALGWRWHSPRAYYKSIVAETNDSLVINKNFNIKYLNNYQHVDFSTTYTTDISNKTKLLIGLSIRNLFNHTSLLNIEQNSYFLDTSLNNFKKYSLGRTFNFSIRFLYH